jgi:peptidoglycan/LPS O-acetylase OafA/YrhL
MLLTVTAAPPARPKFEFADGLRAIAALTVAIYHATMFTGYLGDVQEDLPLVDRIAEIGNYAVPVFIVLSGFVLMLPVARSEDLELRGGFGRYIGRRAKRILPPYYASLLLFLIMIWTIPVLQVQSGTAWDNKIPVTIGGVVSHLLVVHNLSPEWIYQINGPAWSIATEWQIYFLMPLVLLPLWRRLGPWWTTAIAIGLGFALSRFVPNVGAAHFWLIGLFGMGMLAAFLAVRRTRFKAGWPALIMFVAAVGWLYIDPDSAEARNLYSESLIGAAIALALLWLAAASLDGRRTWLHRILETRFLVWVGLWSYSLYLIHSPMLALGNLLLLPLGLPTWLQLIVMLGVVLPAAGALAYVFHRLVERHFITTHQKAEFRKGSREAQRTEAGR